MSEASPAATLVFRDLRRGYGRLRVLGGVSGAVRSGRALVVLGPNGCGKSTLLRCLAGLLRPQSGSIDYREGERQLDAEERRRSVGYLAPDLALYEELSALENLEFFAKMRRTEPGRARTLLDRVALPPGRAFGALSSGMRQRLRWAFALLHRPQLLLLDEPFQNLDAAGHALAGELLREHLATGLAVIASPTTIDLPVPEHVLERLELSR